MYSRCQYIRSLVMHFSRRDLIITAVGISIETYCTDICRPPSVSASRPIFLCVWLLIIAVIR